MDSQELVIVLNDAGLADIQFDVWSLEYFDPDSLDVGRGEHLKALFESANHTVDAGSFDIWVLLQPPYFRNLRSLSKRVHKKQRFRVLVPLGFGVTGEHHFAQLLSMWFFVPNFLKSRMPIIQGSGLVRVLTQIIASGVKVVRVFGATGQSTYFWQTNKKYSWIAKLHAYHHASLDGVHETELRSWKLGPSRALRTVAGFARYRNVSIEGLDEFGL